MKGLFLCFLLGLSSFGFVMWFEFEAYYVDDVYVDTVYIGLDSAATNGFDPALDRPSPPSPPPPVNIFAYFPLDDPRYPFIRALDTDFRNILSNLVCWEIRVESWGADSIFMRWDSSSVSELAPSRILIGADLLSSFPSSLYDAETIGRLRVYAWQKVDIIYARAPGEPLNGILKGTLSRTFPESVRLYAYNPRLRFDPFEIPSVIVAPGDTFEFHLPPADYMLIIDGRVPSLYPSTRQFVGSRFVRLSPGDTIMLDLSPPLPAGFSYTVSGRVKDSYGLPVPYAIVFAEGARINNPNALVRFAIADSAGDFTINDLNAYGVVVWAYQVDFVPRYYNGDIHWASACTLYPASVLGEIELVLEPADTSGLCGVYGKIVGPAGLPEPITGARIYAINSVSDTVSATIATYNGEFILNKLVPDDYTICVDAYRYEPFCVGLPQPLTETNPYYNLGIISLTRSTGIDESNKNAPRLIAYPNPFNAELTIELGETPSFKRINIYDITGKIVRTVGLSGVKIYRWDGTDNDGRKLPSGVYFIGLDFEPRMVMKVVLLR